MRRTTVTESSPARRVLPAEWEPHRAVWLGWPTKISDWSPKFQAIPWVYGEMVRQLAASEEVRLLVDDERVEARARSVLTRAGMAQELPGVRFVRQPTDRGWTRDFMPFFTVGRAEDGPAISGSGMAVDCGFTGWARYPDHTLDDAVSVGCAAELGWDIRTAEYDGRRLVLEGGGVDTDGAGTVLVTEEWLLDTEVQVRNPGMTRQDYEAAFAKLFGTDNTIWLGRGIAGDDTHGHVDDFCRFVGPGRILLCREPDGGDMNHRPLEENRERLEDARLADGSKPEVVFLPMPQPVWFDGMRLPASYGNFYIGNSVVLVPTFNDPNDRAALGILAECFPDRRVVGIHAVDLALGFGGVHCLTHEQPEALAESDG
ncbi:agmatine deiminase family protein [Oceanidesulfovibrio marinus]|uniref:Agmatine deiminase family protein n=1 Tax=Oceanidesulfovibrio marinus TaxID=370038 RepID=A0ABX6NKN5_9BACT|nr:agmatine deiminase family protein [Oceanidesulfovibrio marinus]